MSTEERQQFYERRKEERAKNIVEEVNAGYDECSMALRFDKDEALGLDWLSKTLSRIAKKGEDHPSYKRAIGVVSAIEKIGEYRAFSHAALHEASFLLRGMQDEIEKLRAELRIERGGEVN